MGRASDMTTYGPTVEDMELPKGHQWDKDGLPQWIIIGLRNWKSRAKKNVGVRYGIKLHRNYLDSRFCPVKWLLAWLRISGIKSGPIFGNVTIGTYHKNINHILRIFMGLDGGSSHSVRRSAAQWVGRSLVDGIGCRNAGRWRSWEHMMTYVAQGAKEALEWQGTTDPLFRTWVFKPVTSAGLHDHRKRRTAAANDASRAREVAAAAQCALRSARAEALGRVGLQHDAPEAEL
ncbi:hypothetical protein M885DRAFT_577308 [Pelagophyceae sp. CCMP2097]|nr:hypothetical protein M885DRAFT_577308 [Pelagophyceae sp. CCMP2097]